jgi:hypothetical protein
MSGTWAPPGGEPARPIPTAPGWYPDPVGWDAFRWWNGTAWGGVPSWPAPAPPGRTGWPGPAPAGPSAERSAWLARRTRLAGFATVTMVGWAGGAVFVAASVAATHPILPALAADALVPGLALANVIIGHMVRRAARAGQVLPVRPAGARRGLSRAERRARRARFGRPAAVQAVRRAVARWRRQVFASLPRPVAWFFTAAIWSTVGALAWVNYEAVVTPGVWGSDVGATVPGQQLVVLAGMLHLIAWSGMAWRRLDRPGAPAQMIQVGKRS